MDRFIRIFNIMLGCIIISFGLNYFVLPNQLVTIGSDGLACLFSYIFTSNVYINMFILNVIILLFSLIFIDKQTIKLYIVPAVLIPIISYLTSFISKSYPIQLPEMMVSILVASFLIGIGYSFIFKAGYKASVIFIVEDIFSSLTNIHSKSYSFVIDIFNVILTVIFISLNVGLYSLIMIIIIRYLITKAEFGINDYKMFYVITDKEKEVRDYIVNDLHYKLTTLDVIGGYSKKSSKILLSVISSNDYFRLKEGIKLIDNHAFIAIVDTYDCINRKIVDNYEKD